MLADGFLTIASVKSLSASSKFPVREGNILIGVKKKRKTFDRCKKKKKNRPSQLTSQHFTPGRRGTLRTTTQVVQLETRATNSVVKCFLLAAKKADKPSFIAAIASILFVEDSSLISSVTLEINPSY